MRKTSVSFPAFDWQRDGVPLDDMACNGLTAQMHHKLMGGNEGRSQSRRKESSLVPPITPRRLSASSRSSSSSKDQNGAVKQKNSEKSEESRKNSNFEVREEIGYLETENSCNRSTTSISNMGQKLPDILKAKEKSTNNSKSKRKAKRGKKKADGKSTWKGLQDVSIPAIDPSIDTGAELEIPRDDFSEWKYGVDWKRRLEWDITRPFTFSYFPNIHQKRKERDAETVNSRAKKSGQGKGRV